MLILLPPSEAKTSPDVGEPLRSDSLVAPSLNPVRARILDALVSFCRTDPAAAAAALGLGPTQADLVERNAHLEQACADRADHVYTGVLYDHLGVGSLSTEARDRLDHRVLIASALFGLVRPHDEIPAYRLSANTVIPGLGRLGSHWRPALGPALEHLNPGLLIDLRSGTYAALHRPRGPLADRTVTVRVLTERAGRRQVVSHANKATKGDLTRALIEHDLQPTSAAELAHALGDLGWQAEVEDSRLDVILRAD